MSRGARFRFGPYALPTDTMSTADIFGGWLLGQMDVAGGVFAATVAVDAMHFAA